jgi:preprotein translocase subunit SecD
MKKNFKTIKRINMKTFNLFIIILLAVLFSCNSHVKVNNDNLNFGIFEVYKAKDIPVRVMESIEANNVQLGNDENSVVIGYFSESDTSVLQLEFSKENIKLVKTFYTTDSDNENYALIAIKPNAVINISDIKKTKVTGNNVKIIFNPNGARKWATITKKNAGNEVAFVIDNQIYSIPRIYGEIKEGIAYISDLENKSVAKEISESLNAGITD